MDLEDVRQYSADSLAAALRQLRIPTSWALHESIVAATQTAGNQPCLPGPTRTTAKPGFQNLVVGTIAERVFREDHLSGLERDRFEVVDLHEAGENRDYAVRRDGLELPINVKVASTLFRNANRVVGLDPENCVPISAYKALGAAERVPDLVYVDLVDFTLREKVDALMASLEGPLAIGWHLLSWYGGKAVRAAEDRYVDALFEERADDLKALAPSVTSYRVISARRVLKILRHHPRRVPGLGVPGAGTGSFVAEVNVHVSVSDEMVAWNDIADALRSSGIQPTLDRIRRTTEEIWPDPEL